MSGFFWSSGHLSWGLFFILVYSAVCWLAGDVAWRLVTVGTMRLAALFGACWLLGVGLILLATA